jgi:hypothetical protein
VGRLSRDGSWDKSFGGRDGIVPVPFDASEQVGWAVLPDSEGRVVGVARLVIAAQKRTAVFRLTRDGSLDTTFGSSGRLILPNVGCVPFDLAVDSLSRLYVALFCDDTQMAVCRISSAGYIDSSFGNGGTTSSPFWGAETLQPLKMILNAVCRGPITCCGPNTNFLARF